MPATSLAELSVTGNDRIHPGANMSPFELVTGEIEAFYDEAKNWASDGFKIENQEQADQIDVLDKALLRASQEADLLRIAEKEPHDIAAKAIQAKFNPFIQEKKGKVDIARASLKALLTSWRVAEQAKKDAEAKRIRDAAEEAERLAQQAFRQTNVADIEQREEAQRLSDHANNLTKEANRASRAALTGSGLRKEPKAVLVNGALAAEHYWRARNTEFQNFLCELAAADVRGGSRSIPGFDVIEEKRAV